MNRYVLRYTGSGSTPAADRATIRGYPGVQVADDDGRVLLIKASPETASSLGRDLTGWKVSPDEVVYTVPTTRYAVLRPAVG